MPPVRARLLGAAVLLALPLALAGCSARAANDCNCCCSAVVDPAGETVWVAQGTKLLKLDARTGEIGWTRQVTSRTAGGSQELTAVSAGPAGVWVAWRAGAALIPGRAGRATRIPIAPRSVYATLATTAGRTWLGAGRRVIALHTDGTTGPVLRFPVGVRIESGPGAIVVRTGGGTVLLDPRSGKRLSGGVISMRSAWRADNRAEEVTRVDPVTGARAGGALDIAQLGALVEAPGGEAYATANNHELAVLRLDPDGPRIVWRTPIDPG